MSGLTSTAGMDATNVFLNPITDANPKHLDNAYSHIQIGHTLYENIMYIESTNTDVRINAVANISADLLPVNNQTLSLNAEGGDVTIWDPGTGYKGIQVISGQNPRVGFGLTNTPEAAAHVSGNIDLTGDIYGSIGLVQTYSRATDISLAVNDLTAWGENLEGTNPNTQRINGTNFDVPKGANESTMACLIICSFTVERNFQGAIEVRTKWWADLDGNNDAGAGEVFYSASGGFDYQTSWNQEAGYLLPLKGLRRVNVGAPTESTDHRLYIQLRKNTGLVNSTPENPGAGTVKVKNFQMIMYALPVSDENLNFDSNGNSGTADTW